MRHTILTFSLMFIVNILSVSAQESKVQSLLIVPSGEAFGTVINSPTGLLANQTFTLPSTGGTLLVSSGGNVSLDFGGELRLFETGGPNYTGLKSGNVTADITYTLPIAAPTTGQVLTAGATPTELEWSTVVTPVPSYTVSTVNATSNSNFWVDGVSVAVQANTTYLVEVRATFVPTSDTDPDAQFRFGVPASATLTGGYSTLSPANGDAIAGYLADATAATTLPANGGFFSPSSNQLHTLYFTGTLTVNATSGNVVLQFTNVDAFGSTVLRAGAVIKVTPL